MKHPPLIISAIICLIFGSLLTVFSSSYLVIGLCLIFAGLLLLLMNYYKKLALILLSCFAGLILIFEIPIIKGSFGTMDNQTGCDYLILCGAGIDKDKPSPALSDRLRTAADYLSQNKNAIVICSGGQGSGEDISEAECMRRYLIEAGIEEDRIRSEDTSTTTRENLINSFAMIKAEAGSFEPIIGICSSEYHLRRIGYLSEKMRAEPVLLLAAQTTDPLSKINYFLYEIPAGIKAFIQINYPPPKGSGFPQPN